MSFRTSRLLAAIVVLVWTTTGCSRPPADVIVVDDLGEATVVPTVAAEYGISPRILRRFAVLEHDQQRRLPALVSLGRMLYYETRLSKTGDVSCNTCHPLESYGVDGRGVPLGVGGQRGRRNTPSTYNAAGQFRQFWDGRAATLEEQVRGPLESVTEMAMPGNAAADALRGLDQYQQAFRAAFPGDPAPISIEHVATAIGAFERGLLTPSRWDRYLAGETNALSSTEKEGARQFANNGCLVCHAGALAGGSMFEKVGALRPWPAQGDRGRREVTGNPADDMMFKVPSLRNVARTAPYFHDGSVATLASAVEMMARYQLDVELTATEVQQICAWLESLTGDLPREYIAPPIQPGQP